MNNNTNFDTLNNLDTSSLLDDRVSINNFSTSNEEINKSRKLEEAKATKLRRLQEAKGKTNLDDSWTELDNGTIESNQNKVWNQLSDNEFQSAFTYALDNNTLTRDEEGNVRNSDGSLYSGNTRRLYMYGSKDSTDDVVKLGLSRGDENTSDSRYTRYPSGEIGVDTENKFLDVLLPENVAVTLEGMAHGREGSMKGRVMPDIYSDPDLKEGYGSGVSEYYKSKEDLFGTPEAYNEQLGRDVFNQYTTQPSSTPNSTLSQRVKELEADNAGVMDRAVNTIQGFGATFVDTLIASPLNAIGQLTGVYSFGDADEVTDTINKGFGYNDIHVQDTIKDLKNDWDIITSDEAPLGQKLRSVTSAIMDSVTTPELLGTSLGTIAAWVTPATILKGLGKGAELANRVKKIDDLLAKGKITSAMAKGAKRKAYLSANGGKALAVNQSGQVWSALGAANDQYNEFVKNNNGVELEGIEKAAWFGKAMTIQVMNQNLDKFVDIQAMKAANLLPSVRAVASSMAKKDLANISDIMMGTLKGTLGVGGSMTSEAIQEYAQTTMELYNERVGSEQYKDLDSFVDFIKNDESIDEAGVAMLAGAGGAVQFNAAGKIGAGLSKAQQAAFTKEGVKRIRENAAKLKRSNVNSPSSNEQPTDEALQVGDTETVVEDTIEDNTPLTPEQEVEIASEIINDFVDIMPDGDFKALANTDEETMKDLEFPNYQRNIRDYIKEDTNDVSSTIKKLEQAESTFRRESNKLEGVEKKKAIGSMNMASLAKREYLKHAMENSDSVTLGSGIIPEDVIDDFIDSAEVVDNIPQISEEEKAVIKKYADDNDIPESRWMNLLSSRKTPKREGKDAQEVYEEALASGERSASSYRRTIRDLVNTSNPDKDALIAVTSKNNHFLKTQVERKKAFDKAVATAKEKVASYNTRKRKGEELPTGSESRTSVKKGVKVTGYDEFVAITEDKGTGLLSIHPASLEIQNSIGDNIKYLKRTQARFGKDVSKILGKGVSDGEGLVVRPAATSGTQTERDKDETWYKRTGVTKVIIDEDNPSKKWSTSGDYYKDNSAVVNTGEYTSDDVVMFVTTATKHPKKAKFFAELTKAREAGATVVVDREFWDKTTKPHSLLKNAHFSPAVLGVTDKSNGYTVYVPSKDKAEELNKKSETKKKAKAEKDAKYVKLHNAFYENDQKTIDEITEDLFGGDPEKSATWYENQVKAGTKAVSEELEKLAIEHGFESTEIADEMVRLNKNKTLPKEAISQGIDAFFERAEELQKGSKTLAEWKSKQEEAKKGNEDYDQWLKSNVDNPKKIAEDMLKNSVGNVTVDGKARKPVRMVYDPVEDIWDPESIVPADKREGANIQDIALNPNDYVQVSKVTPLNSYPLSELRIEGTEGIPVNSLISTAVKSFNEALSTPSLDIKEKKGGKETGNVLKTGYIDLTNSPAATMIFEVTDQENMTMKVNENVAAAMQIALGNLVKNNGPFLKKKRKSRKAVAEMLGIDETRVTPMMVDLIGDKGMLYKNLANSAGKDVANLMGISRKSNNEVDAQAYDALVADLGQMVVMIGINEGLFQRDTSVTASRYAEVMLGKVVPDAGRKDGAKVMFINIAPNMEETSQFVSDNAKKLEDILPDTDVSRKEPSYTKFSEKEVDNIINHALRNTKLDVGIAPEIKKALKELTNTEWSVDLKGVRKAMEDIEFIKKGMGYVEISEDNPEYRNMTHENKDIQESINNEIEKGIEELKKLADENEGDSMSVWFPYFFSSNGRFFMDTNTVNPQGNKHWHRFFVQPKSHEFTVKRVKGKFIQVQGNKDIKDITHLVNYAIAQGVGFSTDKRNPEAIDEVANKVLKTLNTKKRIQLAKDIFTGKHVVGDKKTADEKAILDLNIGFEHYSQTLQTFTFLEDLVGNKTKPFNTTISAEFDAVTSGFGLKLLQVPLLAEMDKWLTKVGMVQNGDEHLDNVKDSISMNSLLDGDLGGLLDSYQTLASDMKETPFSELMKNGEANNTSNNVIVDTPFTKKVWSALYDVMPKKNLDDSVSKELRNLFKPGFMTFNYSAGIRTIKKNLASEVAIMMADQMASVNLDASTDENSKIVALMLAYTNGDMKKAKELQTDIRTKPFNTISTTGKQGTSLKVLLEQMVEASYGTQIEQVFEENFGEFIEAQTDINNAFKAMFEVFIAEVESKFEEARKDGVISKEKEEEIYNSVKDKWPAIKGPLAAMEDEVLSGLVGVYDTETAAPNGVFGGRKPARAKVTKKLGDKLSETGQTDIRVSHMIRKMSAAVSAGSVIPIHHLDGAAITRMITKLSGEGVKGIATIHDAIIPPLVHADISQYRYNGAVIEIGAEYSFIGNTAGKIVEIGNNLDWEEPTLAKAKVKVKERGMKKEEEKTLKEYFQKSLSNIYVTAQNVNEGRQKLFDRMYSKGFHIMHMAGTKDGVYSVEAGSKNPFKPFDLPKIGKYNSNPTINNVTMDDIDADMQNLCP